MTRFSGRDSCAFWLLLGALALARPPVRADDEATGSPPRADDDTRALRFLLQDSKLEALSDLTELEAKPAQTLLIVLGAAPQLRDANRNLLDFLTNGGSLLIASDRRDATFPDRLLGFRVNGQKVVVGEGSAEAFQGEPDCPLIEHSLVSHPEHPLFRGLFRTPATSLATNRSSYLEGPNNGAIFSRRLHRLLNLPECTLKGGGMLRSDLPFAVGTPDARPGESRILAFADHSIFIDEMMLRRDTGNFDFAYNCLDWLTEGGKRPRVLFIDNGAVQTSFDVPLQKLPTPAVPPLPGLDDPVGLTNAVIAQVERENLLNRLLLELIPLERVWQLVLLGLTLLVVAYGIYRIQKPRGPSEEVGPLFVAGGRAVLAWNVLDRRQQALQQQDNYWEAARMLSREGLRTALGRQLPSQPTAVVPAIVVDGGWWERRRVRKRFDNLWGLAYNIAPRRVPAVALGRVTRDLEAIQKACAAGSLRLLETAEPAR